ncbi:hypothetical protein [Candidatus Berkiella aquae]|nr:hypothetical protein [Candidatus Berkiella aquae]MCS5712326.1 hypothetical protein [Candidatus Berkiella aquae]
MTLPLISLGIINYIIDPFSVFHSGILPYDYEINERFNKIKHLDQYHERYNAYIMGSSRSGTTSPSSLEKHIPDSHFYNMTVAGCTQYDNELHLRYFIEKQYPIKHIFLQIDISDIYGFKAPEGNYNAKHHPHVMHTADSLFYLSYLTVLPVKRFIEKIKVNYFEGHQHYLRYDLTHSGRWYVDYLEEQIHADPLKYIQEQSSFNQKMSRGAKGTKIIENINALKRFKALADAQRINVIVYIAPHNHNMMDTFEHQSYLEYLREISKITPFWDFSGYNAITLNDGYYYESSHYRDLLAELLIKRIFNDHTSAIPHDFGHYITANNIEAHLQNQAMALAMREQLTLPS